METEVKEGKKAWIGNGVIVDKDVMLNLIERIRIALPQATGEAQVLQAKKDAQEIIELANKGPSSQGYGFSSSHVCM